MKIKKKSAMVVAFALSALLIATTAFAEISQRSAYEQLKDAIKATTKAGNSTLDSFTMESSFVMKAGGKIYSSETSTDKYDRIQGTKLSTKEHQSTNGERTQSLYYSDKRTDINYHSREGTYYVVEYDGDRPTAQFPDPFSEPEAADVERIIDALVGSLRDQVTLQAQADGSKEFYGSLNEAQIPTLINALASFELKQSFFNDSSEAQPYKLIKDVYVKGIGGSAKVRPDGLLESLLGTATLSGKDAAGNDLEITLDVLFRFTDINATVVTPPDLTNQKVVKQEGKLSWDGANPPGLNHPESYIGAYKNDILKIQDGKFVKIGERQLEITALSQASVAGRYTEVYLEEYAASEKNKMEYSFQGTFRPEDPLSALLVIEGGNNAPIEGNLYIDDYAGKINLHTSMYRPTQPLDYDPMFSRIFP